MSMLQFCERNLQGNNRLTVVSDIYDPLRMADELGKFEAAQRKVPLKSWVYQETVSNEWPTFLQTLWNVCESVEAVHSNRFPLPIDLKLDRGPSVKECILDDYRRSCLEGEAERHMRSIEDTLRDNAGGYMKRRVGLPTYKKKGKMRRTS